MLRGWLGRQGFFTGREPSHYLLDGGKLFVPPFLAGSFNNLLAAELAAGAEWHVTEVKTPVFKLLMDLDCRAAEPLAPDSILPLCCAVAAEAAATFEGSAECVVCFNSAAGAPDPKGGHKTGCHLIFPELRVDSATALAFRARLLASPAVQAQAGLFCASLEEIIDGSVLAGTGLRMIGCRKGRGKGAGVYWPTHTIREGQAMAHSFGDVQGKHTLMTWMQRTSVRCQGHPSRLREPLAPAPGRPAAGAATAAALPPEIEELRTALPEAYRRARFSRLSKSEGAEPVYFLSLGSRHCLNKGGEHRSNNVYLLLTPTGVYQKCHCKCPTGAGRLHGPCSSFKSRRFAMPAALRVALWTDEELAAAAARATASILRTAKRL